MGKMILCLCWQYIVICYVYTESIINSRSTDIIVGRLKHTPKDFVSYAHIALLRAGITDENRKVV